MIAYFDTSALVPLVVDEPTTEPATRLWGAADRVVGSSLTYVEARAALARARRIGRLDADSCRAAVLGLEALVVALDTVEVSGPLVRRAGALADDFDLRGYDAIHLASAELVDDRELVLVTGDLDLVRAAGDLGLGVAALGGPSSRR